MQRRKIGKGLCCWLIWVLVLSCSWGNSFGDSIYEGNCGTGSKLKFSYLFSENKLCIWGTGAMRDYTMQSTGEPDTLWNDYRQEIHCVEISNGSEDNLTKIGNYAFYDFENLTSITIPDSVTSIGEKSFYGCAQLDSINLPDNIESIGENAFTGCSALNTIHVDSCNSNSANWAYENGLGDKVEAKFHQIVDVEAKQPTCTEEGYTSGKRCINCQKIIEALKHQW